MRRLSLLLVGGHPADAFNNAGGTLAHHVERGDRVIVAVLTHGVRSHASLYIDAQRKGVSEREHKLEGGQGSSLPEDKAVEELVEVKQQEAIAACKILGIEDVRFLYYEDEKTMCSCCGRINKHLTT